jgi:thymidylate synthase
MTNPTLDSQAAIPPLANTNSFAQATVSPEFDESLTEKNLDMVRNILFGEQARETEKRQIMLERFVKVWTSSIREEMRKNLDAVQSEVRLLKDLLAEENKARLGDVAQTRERFIQIGRTLEEMSRRQNLGQEELHQRLSQEVSQLKQALLQQRQDLLTQVKVAIEQLKHDKADRQAIASLLGDMAKQLSGELG